MKRPSKPIHRWGRRLLVAVNVMAAVGILCAYLSTHVPPSSFWPFAFFGLGYPFLLWINVFFIIWWLFRRQRKLALISGLCILIGFGHLTNFFQFSTKGSIEEEGKAFKLLSYNVRLFDLYNFTDNKQTRNKIFNLLNTADADIYCFQEFYHTDREGYFETKDTLVTFLKTKNLHQHFQYYPRKQQYFGVVTMTRYPIIHKGNIPFKDNAKNHCIFTDMIVGTDTVRVYNVHLASIRFGKEDYAFMSELNNGETGEGSSYQKGRRIASRLKQAFLKREYQIERITTHIDACPYPVILAGDFNDTPVSWAYSQINERLTDAFTESGNGVGATYIGPFPSFRIDYIFHSEAIYSCQFEVHAEKLSDHRAVSCWMELND